MDVSSFVTDLLAALASIEAIDQVALETEGPIVKGRAYLSGKMFLAFYYNQATATQAFALVKDEKRLWGIDYDNFRGWHLHPMHNPDQHVVIESLPVSAIIQQLKQLL